MRVKWFVMFVSVVLIITGLAAEGAQEKEMSGDPVIYTEEISYTVDGQNLVGMLAYDESVTDPRPGVIVVHEWQGINDYAKKRAVDLAKEGYVAFALDMYGDGKEVSREEARSMSGKIGTDYPLVEARFNAALDILKGAEYTDPDRIGAIGYCFGGGVVLNMARLGTEIEGVVGFHSSINTGLTAGQGDIKTKILAIQGDQDPAAPRERQQAFIEEMTAAEADFSYIVYGNLPAHNFTNPEGSSYYEDEAEMAWASMLTFFDSLFE